eukprot:1193526-Prorocentrum_minimum.AAC.1
MEKGSSMLTPTSSIPSRKSEVPITTGTRTGPTTQGELQRSPTCENIPVAGTNGGRREREYTRTRGMLGRDSTVAPWETFSSFLLSRVFGGGRAVTKCSTQGEKRGRVSGVLVRTLAVAGTGGLRLVGG